MGDFIVAPQDTCHTCLCPSGRTYYPTNNADNLSLLRSNNYSTGSERQSALDTIAQKEAEIESLDQEITRLRKCQVALEKHREEARTFVVQRKSLLAPIRTVPDDLMCQILLLALTYSSDKGHINVRKRYTSVRVFTEVCSYWRTMVSSYPLLWSRITVDVEDIKTGFFDTWHIDKVGGMGSYIEKCITNSQQVPLTIEVVNGSGSSLGRSCRMMIAQCARRWDTVTFGLGFMNSTLRMLSGPVVLTGLRSLTLYQDQLWETTLSLKPAPILTELHLQHIVNPSKCLLDFPWLQITHFGAKNIVFMSNEFLGVLRGMPKLKTLEFTGETMIDRNTYLILPKLTTLVLSGEFGNLLDVINAPSLITLDLDHPAKPPDRTIPHVISQFLRRSRCELEELKLNGISLDDDWDAEELKALKRLYLQKSPYLLTDLGHLTRKTNEKKSLVSRIFKWFSWEYKYLFPQLEVLHLDVHSGSDEITSVYDVIKLLQSRLPISSEPFGLRNATVNFYGTVSAEDLLELHVFQVRHSALVELTIRIQDIKCNGLFISL